ncbi:hypothetical protein C8F01DRAFT_1254783 [Mycena amicta]|nr:hypothetical protein C8F01DRAFT_1254783 [Mycena amicta]
MHRRLINWMMSSDISLEKVFDERADDEIVERIRECLDTGADFPFTPSPNEHKLPVAFGETLLRLLDSFRAATAAFEMLDAFAPAAVNVWISVTAFLHFVCQSSKEEEEEEEEAKTQRVAALFAPVLLRDSANASSPSSATPSQCALSVRSTISATTSNQPPLAIFCPRHSPLASFRHSPIANSTTAPDAFNEL